MNKAIYYLHIPRTSGVFLRNIIQLHSEENQKKFLSGHTIDISLKDLKNQDYISGHYGLTPIPYSLKTFTILRDPVERSFSYMKYVWEKLYTYMSIEEAFDFFLTNENFKKNISNQSSCFLTSDIDLEEYNKNSKNIPNHVLSNWYLNAKNVNKESVVESVNNNNIEILFFKDPNLYEKIFNIYGINKDKLIKYNKKINQSIETDLFFYKKYYDKIYEINKVDIEVYNFFRSIKNDFE